MTQAEQQTEQPDAKGAGRHRVNPVLHGSFFVAAAVFLALLVPFHPFPGSFVVKAVPGLSLALLVLLNVKRAQGKLLFVGLLLSVAGDVLLDIDREKMFIPGLAAFLTAHLLYAAAFLTEFRFTPGRLVPLALLAIYSIGLGWLLRDIPEGKLIPVMAYLAVITVMAMCTFLMRRRHPLIMIGALVFMASDTILAINKFLMPIPHSTLYNIGIYFVAQYLIVLGFLRRPAADAEK
jgi:uncharacterized membrane protein YhhN